MQPAGRPLTLVTVSLGFFLVQLDATIVNIALPSMQHAVGGTLTGLQWVVDAYTLALAAAMLTLGAQADRHGARRVFLVGLITFGVASAVCAAAPSLGVLVAARALQGLGAAAFLPASLALLVHEFPEGASRARALGIWGALGTLGMAVGPVAGGLLVTLLGWRSVFAVNVPACLLTGTLLRVFVREAPRRTRARWDPAGIALATVGMGALCGGVIESGRGGWTSPGALVPLVAGILSLVALAVVEGRQEAPMLPPALFRNVRFSVAIGLGVVFNLCLYGLLLCLTLYDQRTLAETPMRAGVSILAVALAVGAGSLASGPLTARFGPRRPMLAGMTCGVLGSVVVGFCSLTMVAMTSVVVAAVEPEQAGLAGGVFSAARQGGGALGVALLGSLLVAHGGLSLPLPALAASGGYVVAVGLSWVAGARSERVAEAPVPGRR